MMHNGRAMRLLVQVVSSSASASASGRSSRSATGSAARSTIETMANSPRRGTRSRSTRGNNTAHSPIGNAAHSRTDGVLGAGLSRALTPVRLKLQITRQPKEVFYRWQGGKKNVLVCTVALLDRDGAAVRSRPTSFPLLGELVYEDQEGGKPVTPANLLQLVEDGHVMAPGSLARVGAAVADILFNCLS